MHERTLERHIQPPSLYKSEDLINLFHWIFLYLSSFFEEKTIVSIIVFFFFSTAQLFNIIIQLKIT